MAILLPLYRSFEENYYSDNFMRVFNPYIRGRDLLPAEDWREGWAKEGALIGDGLPVIRLTDPLNPSAFTLIRPYHLLDTDGKILRARDGSLFVYWADPKFKGQEIEMRVGTDVGAYRLTPVFKKALGL